MARDDQRGRKGPTLYQGRSFVQGGSGVCGFLLGAQWSDPMDLTDEQVRDIKCDKFVEIRRYVPELHAAPEPRPLAEAEGECARLREALDGTAKELIELRKGARESVDRAVETALREAEAARNRLKDLLDASRDETAKANARIAELERLLATATAPSPKADAQTEETKVSAPAAKAEVPETKTDTKAAKADK